MERGERLAQEKSDKEHHINQMTALIKVTVDNKMEIQLSARQAAEQNAVRIKKEHEDEMRTE